MDQADFPEICYVPEYPAISVLDFFTENLTTNYTVYIFEDYLGNLKFYLIMENI